MTGQNTSSAVMQQRREAKDSLDDFPTPPWGTRALIQFLLRAGWFTIRNGRQMIVREPAANRGYMVRPLSEVFARVLASDVADYGAGYVVDDYLFPGNLVEVDWTITNPPFRLAGQFIRQAAATSREGFAILTRTAFLEGGERWRSLYAGPMRPQAVLQFTERLVMQKGQMLDPDVPVPTLDPRTGEYVNKRPSTATSYCWLVWHVPTAQAFPGRCLMEWTGVCRRDLTRRGDYPVRVQ